MGHYVAGRSVYENCGPFVIVAELALAELEPQHLHRRE